MPATIDLTGVPYEAIELDGRLRSGDGVFGWKGDPALSLVVGVLTASKNGYKGGKHYRKGDLVARRYEVIRHCEDGTDQRVLSRPLELIHEIIPELVRMDPRTPGFRSTFETVNAHNEMHDRANNDAVREAHGEHMEHLWKLVHDRANGPSTFRQMPGRNPDKQA